MDYQIIFCTLSGRNKTQGMDRHYRLGDAKQISESLVWENYTRFSVAVHGLEGI